VLTKFESDMAAHVTGGGAEAVRATMSGGLAPTQRNRVRVRFAVGDSSPTRLGEVGRGQGEAAGGPTAASGRWTVVERTIKP
jgi:hypothetical protein